jgi:hypothetical protein
MGYDNALCSLTGRPHTPRPRKIRDHPPISEAELVKKRDIFDPLEDDDDIDWKHNPFDVDFIDDEWESPEQLMSKIAFKGSPQLQTRLRALVREFIDVFATKVRREAAAVEPMKIVIDEDKWRLPCNRQPPRGHSEEKQKEIRKQVDVLLKLGAIKESKATEWSQVHLVPKPTPEGAPQKWRFTLDLEGWPIPNIQQIINRIGTLKPKVFGLLISRKGITRPLYILTHRSARPLLLSMVSLSLKGSGPYFQRSMPNNVLQGYVTRICEIYIDDVLLFGTTDDEYIDNTRKVLTRLRTGHGQS